MQQVTQPVTQYVVSAKHSPCSKGCDLSGTLPRSPFLQSYAFLVPLLPQQLCMQAKHGRGQLQCVRGSTPFTKGASGASLKLLTMTGSLMRRYITELERAPSPPQSLNDDLNLPATSYVFPTTDSPKTQPDGGRIRVGVALDDLGQPGVGHSSMICALLTSVWTTSMLLQQ